MSIDVLPSQEFGCPIPPSYCVYPIEGGNKCPYFQQPQPKPEEPSPEVLEELAHQKEIRDIHYSTQKIVHEIQHSKMKLVLLKLTKEIDQLSSVVAPSIVPEIPEVLDQDQEVVPEIPESDVQKVELEV